jgi:aerobic carbon-monoxide dehydrogenase medium subunit
VRDFAFLEPRSVADASAMLAEHAETGRVMAGGTALILLMRQRLASPSHVVWLGGVPRLDEIHVDSAGGLRLGALATHDALATHPGIRALRPMIAAMEAVVANPQIRHAATLGGNLCYGDPASDPPACLLALGAQVRVVRGTQERVIPLDDFFVDYYENALAPGEIVTEVIVPPLPKHAVAVYDRFTTSPAESRPLVAVGLVLTCRAGDTCEDARLALGAVAPVPRRAAGAEAYLRGQRLTADVLTEAASLAVADLDPIDDFRASAEYRRDVTRVIVRRALARALGEAR